MFDLFRRIAVIFAALALVAGGATLAIASKGGGTSGGSAAVTQYSGGTGCTPGYWKNNTGHWTGTGYSPTDLFDTVFGVKLFPGMTLLEVAGQGGNKNGEALGRHAVAALLNSATSTIGYKYSTKQ